MKNEIAVNNDSYIDKQIISGSVFMVQSLDGNKLQYDKLDATLDLSAFIPTLFRPKNADGMLTSENELFGVRPRIRILVADPSSYKTGAVVLYRHNGALVGKYYMDSIERVGKTQYRINCVSPVGVLANSQHYGGIYSGISLFELLSEVIGGTVPFSASLDLADQAVYGWLPVASRRENLHQIMFAMGCAAQKDENGDLFIAPLFDDEYVVVPDSRIYSGGSIRYPDVSTRISVFEHSYIATASDEAITLFEGEVPSEQITAPSGAVVNGAVIVFDGPMHDLIIDNGTILESGVNYAVLAPTGGCKLTGQAYTHTAREIVRPEAETGNESKNAYRVENATLVSAINSENVVDRVASYYGSAKTIRTGIVVDSELAGSVVRFNDPFGDPIQGIISSMNISMSNKLKADTEIVADYHPGNAGNFYNNFVAITEDGSWEVPSGVSKIRVVLISGGSGGEAGQAGKSGTSGNPDGSPDHGRGGLGGAPGAGGAPGKVCIKTLSVTDGQTFAVTIGAGGEGAEFGGSPGVGGATKFGSHTSNDGYITEKGYTALFSNDLYATHGISGVAGSAGRDSGSKERPSVIFGGGTWLAGENGTSASYEYYYAEGGGGGGAAVGSNGADGENGSLMFLTLGGVSETGGDGGNGATPISAESATIPGSGGMGGHGGGGGGGGGGVENSMFVGAAGIGGTGGAGGNGAPGVVLIYY